MTAATDRDATAHAPVDPPLLEQDLCTGCAACCDGTMFSYVQVTSEEKAGLGDVLTLEEREDDAVFYQPCPHSVCQRCQIYDRRPGTCRTFRCKTLNALRNGEIDTSEAFRRVEEMIRSRAQLVPLLQEGETLNQARQRRQDIASDPSRVAGEGAFLLRLTAFDLLLDRYFRNPGKAMFSRNSTAGSDAKSPPGSDLQ